MSSSRFDDPTMTSGSGVTPDVHQVLRLSGAKSKSQYCDCRWKRRNPNGTNTSMNLDVSPENFSNVKISNGFWKNIKKHLRIKNLAFCKFKEKIIGIESKSFTSEISQKELNDRLTSEHSSVPLSTEVDRFLPNPNPNARSDAYLPLKDRHEEINAILQDNKAIVTSFVNGLGGTDNEKENENSCSTELEENVAEPRSTTARLSVETVDSIIDAKISNENKAKINLSDQLIKLRKYGWYWGPISGDEADSKLVSEPDGAFLVRDSSDDRYLLTLSFKSSGRLLHARMEHSGGLFSLWNRGENKGFTSVAALIDHSMNSSRSAVFCYSRPKHPGYPSFPIRLTKPVSRFTQVRSLQYLCRFVIRQNTRLDNIHKLPLPKTIRGYIEEAHY